MQREAEELKIREMDRRMREKEIREKEMQNHFNNNQNNNQNRQQWMQQMNDTKPHNFIEKKGQDMYGENNNKYGGGGGTQYNGGGAQYNGGGYGGQPQYQATPTYNKPFVNYGVSSNQRPAVVSQGGCCCSVM